MGAQEGIQRGCDPRWLCEQGKLEEADDHVDGRRERVHVASRLLQSQVTFGRCKLPSSLIGCLVRKEEGKTEEEAATWRMR